MRTRVEVSSELAVVALADASAELPAVSDPDALSRALEPRAREGAAFFLVTGDPVRYRLDVLVDETPSPELARELEPTGGAFGLEAPSGRLAVTGWSAEGAPVEAGRFEAVRGRLRVAVWSRRPFDPKRHDEDMRQVAGGDWAYYLRVDRLGLVGCLPTLLGVGCLLLQRWSCLTWAVPLLVASWLPYVLLRRTPRYVRAETLARELEESRPHFALVVSSGAPPDLAGGFLRVQ